ncbi:hypothetical protein [Arenibaculum sp.]|uniref:hypothetical protein n=1 Tax=Arenibaculum sp. TaxID=2865862 RepID=UPI002E150DA0|nr:hypothetical protein [Arenibaculum sp.]
MTGETFRYPKGPLLADYARSGGGLVLTAGPLLAVDVAVWAGVALGTAALLFALFGLRTAQRHATVVELDEDGVRARGPLGGRVSWSELRSVRLTYYSTRRDRREGWMHMTLRGGGTVKLESSLDGFDLIAERAAAAARARRLPLGEATVQNFAALGIDADPEA